MNYPTIKSILSAFFVLAALGLQAQSGSPRPAGELSVQARDQLKLYEDSLGLLAYAVVNDSIEQERFAACRVVITSLVRALKVENSFRYPFERLRSISILAPPDSSFRIFTWQLFVNDSTYRYYGAIQMNQSDLRLYPLVDRSFELTDRPEYEQFTPERWFGALYYNLRPFETREGRKYLLFGYNAFSFFEKRKMIEVLSFDAAGKPVFGAPVFDRSTAGTVAETAEPQQRMLLEYSAEAAVKLNWDEQYKMVLFDHLIPMPSPFGRGMTYIPDGSYEGFRLENGHWTYVEKVFNDVMTEVPRPEPILDTRKEQDIMGRQKKQGKGRKKNQEKP